MNRNTAFVLAALLIVALDLRGDEVTIQRGGSERTLEGNILVEAQNENGILFQTRDGRIWNLEPDEIKSKTDIEEELKPLSRKELGQRIQSELNDEFKIHEAGDFVIVYNTHQDYARWVAGLYRKFERGFNSYWPSGFKPEKPEFPLAIIIFNTRHQYLHYMKREIGVANPEMIAYYNLETNRVAMFDLTADEFGAVRAGNDQRRIADVLNNPRAIPMVATIIHEGTHQLMFNNGMQTRFSDTPLWINEGIAMYFEVPDLSSSRGWRKIGQVNFLRLRPVLKYFQTRPADSLEEMIRSDKAFRGGNALDMYAQAWAFNYFLLNKYKKPFVDYLKFMSQKPKLIYDTPDERLADFKHFFKMELSELDREFVLYIQKLNRQ